MFQDLGIHKNTLVNLFCDNKDVLQAASTLIYHERKKHIEINCHQIRKKVQQGIFKTSHVNRQEQIADILTKGLCSRQH